MLSKYLKKVFNHATDVAQTEEVNMTQETAAQATATEEMAAMLAASQETVANMTAELADVKSKYEAATAALNASKDAQEMLVKQAAEARLSTRTTALAAVMGADNAKLQATLSAMDVMPDDQFNLMVGVLSASMETEANSTMFKEVGVAAVETPQASAIEETAEMKLIKAQLAANAEQ